MSNNEDNLNNYFDEYRDFAEDKIKVEIPIEQKPSYQEKIPSAYDPMGEVYLRGRAMRNLSSGTMPWWVLITGWVLFGGFFFLFLGFVISSISVEVLPALILTAIPLLIVLRGTIAKFQR